ncbi:MAG: MBL fold metallo-hydrolase [Vulcanimicrobiaceae bacterium]
MDHINVRTTSLGDGIVQLRLPMVGNPLRYVNAYLLEETGGYTLVDCGWKADDVLAAVHDGLADCGIGLHDVARVLITHAHFDHYGLAGTLRRAGVRELYLHRLDWAFAQLLLRDPGAADAAADDWIARNGFRLDEADDDTHAQRNELTEPTHLVEDGERIGRLRAVWTPGHTPGHLCFVDSRSGKMLTGDHILDPITPHVGVWRDRGGNPLDAYVASLHKVAAIGATGVLPAHGEPFPDLQRRVAELLAHEAEREARVLAVLAGGASDAATVARALTWTRRERPLGELAPAHQQFAVAETLAHLEGARARGLVTRDAAATPYAYALA